MHHGSQFKKGGFNRAGYANPKLDQLAIAQQAAMNMDKRREIVFQAQKVIANDQPDHVLVSPKMTNAYREDRLNRHVPQMGEGIGSFWSDINMTVISGNSYVVTGASSALKISTPWRSRIITNSSNRE